MIYHSLETSGMIKAVQSVMLRLSTSLSTPWAELPLVPDKRRSTLVSVVSLTNWQTYGLKIKPVPPKAANDIRTALSQSQDEVAN